MKNDDFNTDELRFEKIKFTSSHMTIILISFILFGIIIFAVQEFDWWINEMAGGFLLIGIVAAVISKIPINILLMKQLNHL